MGQGYFSQDFYNDRKATLKASGTSAFHYSDQTSKKPIDQQRTHPTMIALGANRESRDSADHPDSRAIIIAFDSTGSMGNIPRVLQEKLVTIMDLLIKKNYIQHPQIMFGAVGDATCDRAPIQVGQFESDNRMEEHLSHLFLEGGGGGQRKESYELMAYFALNHTKTDCFEKRGEKGYMFFIGDEAPYPFVYQHHIKELIGDTVEADIPTEEVFAQLQDKYEVYCLIPDGTQYHRDRKIKQTWQDLLHERVIQLEDPSHVSEAIASIIGVNEGNVDLDDVGKDLRAVGTNSAVVDSVTKALAPISGTANKLMKSKSRSSTVKV